MAVLEFDLSSLEYDNDDRQYLIESVLTDDDKWNITYDCFRDDPETFMMWITDDLLPQDDMERCFSRERLKKLYEHLKSFYDNQEVKK